MKKYLSLFMAAVILIASFTACDANQEAEYKDDGNIKIVTTIFPEYDWVKNILGDNPANAELSLIMDNGVDLHSYQATTEDILQISTCDLFIYVGGESDIWVKDALAEASNKDMLVINLLDVLGDAAKEEEVIEGMQVGHEHEQAEHAEHNTDDHKDEHAHKYEKGAVEYDEHVWLSLRNASIFCDSIAAALESLDPDHASTYQENASSYKKQLTALDREYEAVVSDAESKTLVFGDRFPFLYLFADYGLDYYAAFVGCSAETEASFETIVFLANKVDELALKSILTIEGNNHRIAETIKENTQTQDQTILTLDSMQGITAKDLQKGKTYLSIMESNLSVLKEALS